MVNIENNNGIIVTIVTTETIRKVDTVAVTGPVVPAVRRGAVEAAIDEKTETTEVTDLVSKTTK